MNTLSRFAFVTLVGVLVPAGALSAAGESPAPPTMSSVLEASQPSDWAPLDPANTLYMTLPRGRVVIRLAPDFAPRHVANLKKLVAERYFDGLAVVRSQENYVVQWGDPLAAKEGRREMKQALPALEPEFDRGLDDNLRFTPLADGDVYAPEVGFVDGFPVAAGRGRIWLAHCHGMLGAGRAESAASGSGAELYVVIGHSPRHLDRNVTLLGRVVLGIEVLSTLPRGTGGLGFYEDPAEHVEIESIRMGSELPAGERAALEILRTDTPAFRQLIEARRTRTESWFVHPTGRVSLCNVPLPVREIEPAEPAT